MRNTRGRPARGKAISAGRDRMQSELLAGAAGALLVAKAITVSLALHRMGAYPVYPRWFWISCGYSAGFALVVWLLRSATAPAAVIGGVICLNILLGQGTGARWQETAMPALLALFLLTFAATRFGRSRKERLGLAEPKTGRRAAQVIANLGVAGLCGGASSSLLFAACVAALAEATADTMSSELGQALGGRTLLLTSWQEVPAGTNGGISVAGTTLGAAGAGVIVLVTAATGFLSWQTGVVVLGAALAGLVFDSWLGATVERRGWLGNDLVNFSSTIFAAVMAWVGTRMLAGL
jgi:uncharacterized protein (TIGR00297 family)